MITRHANVGSNRIKYDLKPQGNTVFEIRSYHKLQQTELGLHKLDNC